ncbi:MAG: glycosyltransferase [Patescibacteria group bacterium]
MKILFLNYEYPPLGGGAGNANKYIFGEFQKIPDLEVDFITSSPEKAGSEEKLGKNITIHRVDIGKDPKNLHYQSQKDLLAYAFRAFFLARKLAKKNHYDLSHSFFTVPCGFISLCLKMSFGIPYIVSLRGSDVPGYSERFSWLYKLLSPLIRFIWKKSAHVVANSQGLKELAQKSSPEQVIDVIVNGVDTEEFKPRENKNRPDGIFRILCISRLTHRKGINYLLDAFKIVRAKYPEIELVIGGEGDAEGELREQAEKLGIKNQVNFLGRIPHEKVSRIYASADVFVLPSLNEGMSNTILEAIASGLPVIATDTGGTRELVQEEKNGFVVKTKDAEDIAQKLERLIAAPNLLENMGQASREKAEDMSWKKVAKDYYSLYNEITQ